MEPSHEMVLDELDLVAVPPSPAAPSEGHDAPRRPMTLRREYVSMDSLMMPIAASVEKPHDEDGCCCWPADSFPSRLWSRVKLEHALSENSPGFLLIKLMCVCVLALLLDKGTRNPDTVSSCFMGILALASFMSVGKARIIGILSTGLTGAVIGTLINAACYLPPTVDPNKWMTLLTLPLTVVMAHYVLFFIGIDDPASTASCDFSALYVILVQYSYPPIAPLVPQDDPRILIWQTLLVRVLSISSGCVCAFVVNVVFSASAPLTIYKIIMLLVERFVWQNVGQHRLPGSSSLVQACFSRVVQQVELHAVASAATDTWVFSKETRRQVDLIHSRALAMFRYMNLRSYLELFSESPSCTPAERQMVERIVDVLKRDGTGNRSLRGATYEEDFAFFAALPPTFHVVGTVATDVLRELEHTEVQYLPPKERSIFWGRS